MSEKLSAIQRQFVCVQSSVFINVKTFVFVCASVVTAPNTLTILTVLQSKQ